MMRKSQDGDDAHDGTGSSIVMPELIGQSRAIQRLRCQIVAIAPTDATVLITGETGTGKGLVARLLHASSPRAKRPLVHVDCAVLAQSVIDSELFGHERGSFTGAHERRRGRFELAETGTIFLDEVAEMELGLQAKLLRVLQDREYERVGGTSTLEMKARVVAATNQDPETAVQRGKFRKDLYFRLRVVSLFIPPLRERREDLSLLVEQYVGRFAEHRGISVPKVSSSFVDALANYPWPGNVRELHNYLEYVLIFQQGCTLEARHAYELTQGPGRADWAVAWVGNPDDPSEGTRFHNRDRIAMALIETGGNVSRAARRLGVPRSTLRYHIRSRGLQDLLPND